MKKGKIVIKILWLWIMIFGLLSGVFFFTLSVDNSLRIYINKECHKHLNFVMLKPFNVEVPGMTINTPNLSNLSLNLKNRGK